MTGMKTVGAWTGAVAIAVLATACSDRTERKASDAARETGSAVQEASRGAAEAVANGGRAADAAIETMDVKAALIADSRVDAGAINVDSDHVTKTVTLRGTVPTAEQKAAAESIAREKAVGYRVQNQLTVGH